MSRNSCTSARRYRQCWAGRVARSDRATTQRNLNTCQTTERVLANPAFLRPALCGSVRGDVARPSIRRGCGPVRSDAGCHARKPGTRRRSASGRAVGTMGAGEAPESRRRGRDGVRRGRAGGKEHEGDGRQGRDEHADGRAVGAVRHDLSSQAVGLMNQPVSTSKQGRRDANFSLPRRYCRLGQHQAGA
jgi:hypothetical protein